MPYFRGRGYGMEFWIALVVVVLLASMLGKLLLDLVIG
jgi:hypothetical protein